jgi:hypothetical protein
LLLWTMIIIWHYIWTCPRVWFKNYLLSLLNWRLGIVIIIYVWTPIYQIMFRTGVSCELWPLNVYDLGWCEKVWNPSRFHGLPGLCELK